MGDTNPSTVCFMLANICTLEKVHLFLTLSYPLPLIAYYSCTFLSTFAYFQVVHVLKESVKVVKVVTQSQLLEEFCHSSSS